MRQSGCEWVAKSQATALRHDAVPAAPMSRSVLRPRLVNDAHADDGEDEVGEADGDGLLIAGELAEAGGLENVVEVIKDGVDAGELVECADGDGEEERVAVLPAEDGDVGGGVLLGERGADVGELGLGVGIAHHFEHGEGFAVAILLAADQRGLRGMPKSRARKPKAGMAATPTCQRHSAAPRFRGADEVIGGVGDEDAEDHVELERADEAAAPLGGRKLGDVDGAEDRGRADAESADEAEDHERGPAPGQRAADGGEHVKNGGEAEGFAAAEALAHLAGSERSDDGADQGDGDGPALALRAEVIEAHQRVDGAGDDHGVKAEEQAAERTGEGGLHQVQVGSHERSFDGTNNATGTGGQGDSRMAAATPAALEPSKIDSVQAPVSHPQTTRGRGNL